ncbi:MAG: type II toxin-antitoxin system VapC family toxin [Gammaproteobacteria bacterium]|nr:type II toxin-antitoxin system VapC family toxin [Gammaproteobacteria bacterium]
MNYLINTNVISELVSTKPNSNVIAWFKQIPFETVFLSILTLGEIRKGIEKVKDNKRKRKLLIWLEHDLSKMFDERILAISTGVADRWGRLQAQVTRTLPAIDSLIAATALHYDMALVTRNTDDFSDCPGIEIINPWTN